MFGEILRVVTEVEIISVCDSVVKTGGGGVVHFSGFVDGGRDEFPTLTGDEDSSNSWLSFDFEIDLITLSVGVGGDDAKEGVSEGFFG